MAKFIIVVMDSVGVGELPDAAKYGDEGSNTVGNMIKMFGSLELPNLSRLGLCRIVDLLCPVEVDGSYGKSAEHFPGKDTTGGHFEIAGLVLDQPFPLFSKRVSGRFYTQIRKRRWAAKPLGTIRHPVPRSFKNSGDHHVKTGDLIVYTSADSVFQIAMHEGVIPIEEQYHICEIATGAAGGPAGCGPV